MGPDELIDALVNGHELYYVSDVRAGGVEFKTDRFVPTSIRTVNGRPYFAAGEEPEALYDVRYVSRSAHVAARLFCERMAGLYADRRERYVDALEELESETTVAFVDEAAWE